MLTTTARSNGTPRWRELPVRAFVAELFCSYYHLFPQARHRDSRRLLPIQRIRRHSAEKMPRSISPPPILPSRSSQTLSALALEVPDTSAVTENLAALTIGESKRSPAGPRPSSISGGRAGAGAGGTIQAQLHDHLDPHKALRKARSEAFKNHEEREGLCRLKSKTEPAAAALSGGVGKSDYDVAARALLIYNEGYMKNARNFLTLVKDEDGKYQFFDPVTETFSKPNNDQRYIFVTMEDGTIRVGSNAMNGQSAHVKLSGNAAYVRCAGELKFIDGMPIATVRSGSYLPDLATAKERAGIDCPFGMDFPPSTAQAPAPATTVTP